MTSLHVFLVLWSWFTTHLFFAWTSGAPDHPTHAIYEGSGPQALSIARSIGGHLTAVVN